MRGKCELYPVTASCEHSNRLRVLIKVQSFWLCQRCLLGSYTFSVEVFLVLDIACQVSWNTDWEGREMKCILVFKLLICEVLLMAARNTWKLLKYHPEIMASSLWNNTPWILLHVKHDLISFTTIRLISCFHKCVIYKIRKKRSITQRCVVLCQHTPIIHFRSCFFFWVSLPTTRHQWNWVAFCNGKRIV